ncbi:MAG: XRE family transcriptional regulator [Saprospiraceae bacterium]|jgi:predicted transcriptional regulator|nr:XRE family transcriptional regulator [Saprospiraceae bacterium]MBP7644721.1 XRE family transcriptional regulator [Saprospiraceae bacterium]
MTISLDKVLKSLPKARQEKIEQNAAQLIKEYKSIQDLRKDLGLTQNDLAIKQGVKQVNISNLEKRDDMHLSTLKKYVEALGCELEINIKLPNDRIARIKNLPL